MTLFYLQKELTPPQEDSVDIYKASKKAYNNTLQHKEYQILADMWKNCMNSYLTVRKFLGHPTTCKLLNGWHPLMENKNMMLLTAEWRKANPPPSKKGPRPPLVASSSNSNVKKQPQAQNKGKGKAPAPKPYNQAYRIPKIWQDAVTTTSLTLLLDGCGNPTWSQVRANWSHHIIYGQLAPLGVLWHLHHNPFQWPYPAVIGLLGLFPRHQPPGLHL
ncbi:hypothetical protein O181_118706 [Austropuccinia psidii MF-1]|uniref:Uncharacterized protein n=1 Tax=Austropuccinia psidii MF-1 TaxID=1389203 RepID=A0A9Q3PZ20_9BASI|nr:hypothetical protein [Austropuccinia psidii MF-1]